MKNIRAKIKQKVTFQDEYNKLQEDEFSFKSNQEKNKIYDLKLQNSIRDNSALYKEENLRIQSEAKELIKKTRNMMENLDMNKVKSFSKSPTHKKFSVSFDSWNKKILEEENIENNKKKNFLNNSLRSCSNKDNNLENEIYMKNHLSVNIDNMTKKIINLTKINKNMEKELKDKNALIKKLNEKLDKKSEEIWKLNDLVSKEKSCNLKVEVSTLNRKMITKDKNFEETIRNFEGITVEYKNQISELIKFNDNSTKKIKELEEQKLNMINRIKDLENQNLNLISDLKYKNELFENEKNLNIVLKNQLENYKIKTHNLYSIAKDLESIKSSHRIESERIFFNLFNFYKE